MLFYFSFSWFSYCCIHRHWIVGGVIGVIHYLASILTKTRKNHFTESLIELNLTGTLSDEIDEIATVSEFINATEINVSSANCRSFFGSFQGKRERHANLLCHFFWFVHFQVFHQMLSWKTGDFKKWYSRPRTWHGIKIGTDWRHFGWLFERSERYILEMNDEKKIK